MKKSRFILLLAALVSSISVLGATGVAQLRTESLETPIGIDQLQPRFSWQMVSDRIGAMQTAYRVVVADSPEKLASGPYHYDSGRIASDRSLSIPYPGRALKGSTR